MNPGYATWKFNQLARLRESEAAAAQAAADAAQSDATTGISDAATAQSTADSALALAETVEATADSSVQQTEALAAAAGQVNAPIYYFGGSPLIVGFTCTTSGATIHYRINGGSWNSYSSPLTLTIGDYIEAQGQKGGLTDSGITRYDS